MLADYGDYHTGFNAFNDVSFKHNVKVQYVITTKGFVSDTVSAIAEGQ
jgi:hypothetical protein